MKTPRYQMCTSYETQSIHEKTKSPLWKRHVVFDRGTTSPPLSRWRFWDPFHHYTHNPISTNPHYKYSIYLFLLHFPFSRVLISF
ncbi:hypothetical protein L1887_22350 [Cichorium endivia]|nr:hypothetical protein L1887_22350 [Cichorium endivia]